MTEEKLLELRAFIEGRNAFRDGREKADCPYEDESALWYEWMYGYESAFNEYAESFGA